MSPSCLFLYTWLRLLFMRSLSLLMELFLLSFSCLKVGFLFMMVWIFSSNMRFYLSIYVNLSSCSNYFFLLLTNGLATASKGTSILVVKGRMLRKFCLWRTWRRSYYRRFMILLAYGMPLYIFWWIIGEMRLVLL